MMKLGFDSPSFAFDGTDACGVLQDNLREQIEPRMGMKRPLVTAKKALTGDET
jgi:hypothetical protein